MKKLILVLFFGFLFSASPFFDSSVYVLGNANVRKSPAINSEQVLVAKRNMAFKYLDTVSGDELVWYQIEYYDPNIYDIYYKERTRWDINPNNFSREVDLYISQDKDSEIEQFVGTKRNFRYDDKKAEDNNWVRVRLYKPQIAYIATSISNKIDRPYFLVEQALEAIDKNKYWDYRTRQNILNGVMFHNMTPAMVRATKGEPDTVYEDKSGNKNYYTWFYGGQAVNFRNHRVTSW